MLAVNLLEYDHQLAQLVYAIESRKEQEIVIVHHGKAVAKIILMNEPPIKQRLGVAKGKFQMPDDFDAQNDEVARLFSG